MQQQVDYMHGGRLIHALTGSPTDADWLTRGCAGHGLTLRCCESVAALASELRGGRAEWLILCTLALPPGRGLIEVVDHLRECCGQDLRVLCVAPKADLQLRLDARRAGCAGLYVLPMDEAALDEALAALGPTPRRERPQRILVVDDVALEAEIAARVLRQAEFEVQALTDELAILDSVRNFQPDLILMDLKMPRASGAELTAVLRDQAELLLTPIVFLSGVQEPEAQREALRLGGDAFLSKPVDPQTLVETVRAQLCRSSGIRRAYLPLDELDPVSGLWSRRAFLRALERHLAAAADPAPAASPAGAGDAVLFLAVDEAERLVATGGVGAEELLLTHVGGVLRDGIGIGDRAARFGRFSFTVLARRNDSDGPGVLADRLARALRNRVVQLGAERERLSLSIGIARLADGADAVTQLSRAESACWQAREAGGGQLREHGAAIAAAAPGTDALAEALAQAEIEVRYRPLIGLSGQIAAARRYALEAWLPTPEGAHRLDHGIGTPVTGTEARLDQRLMEQALATLARDRAEATRDSLPLRLFVPQSMATLREPRWVLQMREQLIDRKLVKQAPVIMLNCEDLLAHLGVASALFPLLKRLRLKLGIAGFNTEVVTLSLLAELPISYIEPVPEIIADEARRSTLTALTRTAHEHRVRVIVTGIDDAAKLSMVCESRADLAAGDFVQSADPEMHFDFGAAVQ
jgi:PleD family two-component response regulator/EAL domain-containing protein (putative c-di-GMP-specific phosphodiesterase class I)